MSKPTGQLLPIFQKQNLRHISGTSLVQLSHISKVHKLYILGTFRYILSISQAHLRYILGISRVYQGYIWLGIFFCQLSGLSPANLRCPSGNYKAFLRQISYISQAYLSLFESFLRYFRLISGLSQTYLKNIKEI